MTYYYYSTLGQWRVFVVEESARRRAEPLLRCFCFGRCKAGRAEPREVQFGVVHPLHAVEPGGKEGKDSSSAASDARRVYSARTASRSQHRKCSKHQAARLEQRSGLSAGPVENWAVRPSPFVAIECTGAECAGGVLSKARGAKRDFLIRSLWVPHGFLGRTLGGGGRRGAQPRGGRAEGSQTRGEEGSTATRRERGRRLWTGHSSVSKRCGMLCSVARKQERMNERKEGTSRRAPRGGVRPILHTRPMVCYWCYWCLQEIA